jgi:serine/threonine protein kinase
VSDANLIADRYRRREALGRGAMGEVWLADDVLLGRQVAIKNFLVDAAGGDGSSGTATVDRFLREAQVAARLRHPHAVSVYDLITVDGVPHIVMEFVEGESLAARLRRVGRLTAESAARLIGQVAGALDAAHGLGIVHRDIKPANILIDTRGDARLADFGIARGATDASVTSAGEIIGTVAFMAPEVVQGSAAGFPSDVWSLGATLYVSLETIVPHAPPGQTVVSELNTAQLLVRRVTEAVAAPANAGPLGPLLARMLAGDPAARPSAAEVARKASEIGVRGWTAEPDPSIAMTAPPPQGTAAAPRPAARRSNRFLQFLQTAWTCNSCGADAMPNEEFCRRCGGRVARPSASVAPAAPAVAPAPICGQCGTRATAGSRFCPTCGGSFGLP